MSNNSNTDSRDSNMQVATVDEAVGNRGVHRMGRFIYSVGNDTFIQIYDMSVPAPPPMRIRLARNAQYNRQRSSIENDLLELLDADNESSGGAEKGSAGGAADLMAYKCLRLHTREGVIICAICLQKAHHYQPTTTPCGHVFCKACILTAIRLTKRCPMCNTITSASSLLRLYY